MFWHGTYFPDDVQIYGNVTIGKGTEIAGPADLNGRLSSLTIGEHCDIAAFVTINCADSHMRCIGASTEIERRPIVLGDHVFVGQGATLLGGCQIGHHSVIGAGVVLKGETIPPYSRVHLDPKSLVIEDYFYKDQDDVEAGK